MNIWSQVPQWTRHQDVLTDRPSVVTWLRHALQITVRGHKRTHGMFCSEGPSQVWTVPLSCLQAENFRTETGEYWRCQHVVFLPAPSASPVCRVLSSLSRWAEKQRLVVPGPSRRPYLKLVWTGPIAANKGLPECACGVGLGSRVITESLQIWSCRFSEAGLKPEGSPSVSGQFLFTLELKKGLNSAIPHARGRGFNFR
jgi:hypothetical protein